MTHVKIIPYGTSRKEFYVRFNSEKEAYQWLNNNGFKNYGGIWLYGKNQLDINILTELPIVTAFSQVIKELDKLYK